MNISFYLKLKDPGKLKRIEMNMTYYSRRFIFQTGLKCIEEEWDREIDDRKIQRKRSTIKSASGFNQKLNNLARKLENGYDHFMVNLNHIPSREELMEYMTGHHKAPGNLLEYLIQMQKEEFRGGVDRLRFAFEKWEEKNGVLRVDHLNKFFYKKFILFLATDHPVIWNGRLRTGLMNSTLNERIKDLKSFCKWLAEKRVLRNEDYRKIKRLPVIRARSHATAQEVLKLWNFDFMEGWPEQERILKKENYSDEYIAIEKHRAQKKADRMRICADVFYFTFLTGLRPSDVVRVTKDCYVIALHKGESYPALKLAQMKTRKEHLVALADDAITIFNKYGGAFPLPTTLTWINKSMKECFRLAGFDHTVIIERIVEGTIIRDEYAFYELATLGIARGSIATHLLAMGVPLVQVRDFLGHSDSRITEMYYKASKMAAFKSVLHVTNGAKLLPGIAS